MSIAGVLCCAMSGFVAAPKGLLADDSVNLISSMESVHMLIFFALPLLLMVLACMLVIAGKMDVLSLLSVLTGGVLFAMMDFQYGVSHRTFSGILINMIGVILVAAAVALQVFATETGPAKVSRKAAKSRNPKEFRYERSRRPAYDDIYLDTSRLSRSVSNNNEDGMSEADEYLALDALKAEEEESAAAQKEQEDEIEAMLSMLSEGDEISISSEETEETAETDTADSDEEIEEILAEMQQDAQADAQARAEEAEKPASDTGMDAIASFLEADMPKASQSTAMAHMAEALETPNQTMTDFYEGIEDIFLNQEDQ